MPLIHTHRKISWLHVGVATGGSSTLSLSLSLFLGLNHLFPTVISLDASTPHSPLPSLPKPWSTKTHTHTCVHPAPDKSLPEPCHKQLRYMTQTGAGSFRRGADPHPGGDTAHHPVLLRSPLALRVHGIAGQHNNSVLLKVHSKMIAGFIGTIRNEIEI